MTSSTAQNLDDIEITLDQKALNETNYEDYYVVTKEARGEDPTTKLIRKLDKYKEKDLKVLFSGFKGCGKSTELLRLKRQLEKDYLVNIFSVREELDPNTLTISEILITIMRGLFNFVKTHYQQIKLSPKLIQNLENWTKTIYTEEIDSKYYKGSLEGGLNTKIGFGKILNVFAKLGLEFNAGRKFEEITRKDVKKTLSELILNCNLVVFDIKDQLYKINKKNILFIIEDLEKVDLAIAEEIFYNYPKPLTALSCSIIYTFPISLVYHTKHTIIRDEFDENIILPMIKVHEKDGSQYNKGIGCITEIIFKRIDRDKNLIPAGLLKKLIELSGGCLRDLFRMIKSAAENALHREKEQIEKIDFQYCLNKMKNDYYNTIAFNERNEITAKEYYEILVDCHNSEDKKPIDTKGLIDLKHNMSILGYNGDSWYDVHPVVKEILKDKKMI